MGVRHPTRGGRVTSSALGRLQCRHLRVAGREQDPAQGPRCVHSPLHAWPVPGGSSAEAISLSKHARICSANSSCRCTAGRGSERNRMHGGCWGQAHTRGDRGGGSLFPTDAKAWGVPRRKHGPCFHLLTHTLPQPLRGAELDRGTGGHVARSLQAGEGVPGPAPPLSPPHHRHSHTPPEHHPWPEPPPPSGSPRPMHGGA